MMRDKIEENLWDIHKYSREDLYKRFFRDNIVQIELESSGVCNLNCSYCPIPKEIRSQGSVNLDILQQIKDGRFLKYITEQTKEGGIEHFSLWGTEPSLNIPIIINSDFIGKLMEEHKNLKSIGFSSNQIRNFTKIKSFIKYVNKVQERFNKKINLEIQFSIDGHEEITDKNRGKGQTKEILKTLKELQEYFQSDEFLNDSNNLEISQNFKPTIDNEDIQMFVNQPYQLKKYYDFFENIFSWFEKTIVERRINFQTVSSPTLQLPGFYTNEDGLNYQKFVKMELQFMEKYKKHYRWVQPYQSYLGRFLTMMNSYSSYSTSWSRGSQLRTCSQGDTMLMIDPNGNTGPCHDFMFFHSDDYKRFLESTEIKEMIGRYRFTEFEEQQLQFTPKINDEYNYNHFIFKIRQYHDYFRSRIEMQSVVLLKQQKYQGIQDQPIILSSELYTYLFQLFLTSQFSCPSEQLFHTGSIFGIPISIIKILGNGQFREILKYVIYKYHPDWIEKLKQEVGQKEIKEMVK